MAEQVGQEPRQDTLHSCRGIPIKSKNFSPPHCTSEPGKRSLAAGAETQRLGCEGVELAG